VLDSSRCLSYLTIELKHAVPEEMREAMGSHVYGCDICQEVCPWNGTAPASTEPRWLPRAALDRPKLEDLWRRPDADLRRIVNGSGVKRAGVKRLRRNLAVALGNSGDPSAGPLLQDAESSDAHALARDPLVSEHAAWARRKLEER
jgi:epoxyqueuosine reductase